MASTLFGRNKHVYLCDHQDIRNSLTVKSHQTATADTWPDLWKKKKAWVSKAPSCVHCVQQCWNKLKAVFDHFCQLKKKKKKQSQLYHRPLVVYLLTLSLPAAIISFTTFNLQAVAHCFRLLQEFLVALRAFSTLVMNSIPLWWCPHSLLPMPLAY